jgi:5-methylcytosine-specific restriction protein B
MRSEWSPVAVLPDAPPRRVQPEFEQLPAPVIVDNLVSIDLGDLFIEEDDFSDMVRKLKREKNLILQGPPGVGKTFIAKKLAENFAGSSDRVRWIQFHESYSYEDFIRGYRPDGNGGFRLEDGAFHLFNSAAQKSEQPFVLVIDEINRGKLSKIFGELLMCIESDKRGPKWGVQLPYVKAPDEPPFYVAPNLYVIGLMNTADRSLAVVDYALRRRFSFHTLRPMFSAQRFKKFLLDKEMLPELVDKVIDRLITLNKVIEAELGPSFAIGHSFFCPAAGDELDENWYLAVVRSHIEPLLEEYWFDNRTRVNELMGALGLL